MLLLYMELVQTVTKLQINSQQQERNVKNRENIHICIAHAQQLVWSPTSKIFQFESNRC